MSVPMKSDAPRERRIDVGEREVAIVIREGAEVSVHMTMTNQIERAQLLGLAIAWSCESEEWKTSMMKRARARLMELIEEERKERGGAGR